MTWNCNDDFTGLGQREEGERRFEILDLTEGEKDGEQRWEEKERAKKRKMNGNLTKCRREKRNSQEII